MISTKDLFRISYFSMFRRCLLHPLLFLRSHSKRITSIPRPNAPNGVIILCAHLPFDYVLYWVIPKGSYIMRMYALAEPSNRGTQKRNYNVFLTLSSNYIVLYWFNPKEGYNMGNLHIGLIEFSLGSTKPSMEKSISFCFFRSLALFTPVTESSDGFEVCIRSVVVK